jgi:hypothetical protein
VTENSAPAPLGPRELLTSVRDLTRQVRIAQRATWFPLVVFALIILGAVPVTRSGPRHPGACRLLSARDTAGHVVEVCWSVRPWLSIYWPVALVLAYAAIAGFYLYRSRRRGVGTRVQPYIIVGVVVALLATANTGRRRSSRMRRSASSSTD